MLESLVLLLAALAWLTSVATIAAGATIYRRSGAGADVIDTVGGLSSALLWFATSYGVSSVETVVALQAETAVVTTTHTMLAYLAGGFGALMVVIALMGTGSLVDVRDLATGENREY